MNPWEVVAAKLDRFFFGHDHDTEIVDGAEQLAEAEETEEVWLGYDSVDPSGYYGYTEIDLTSSTDSRRTASVEDGQDALDDPPVARPAHSTSNGGLTSIPALLNEADVRRIVRDEICSYSDILGRYSMALWDGDIVTAGAALQELTKYTEKRSRAAE